MAGLKLKQANNLGRVHEGAPGMQRSLCGRDITDEDAWVITGADLNCTKCLRYKAGFGDPDAKAKLAELTGRS